LSDQQNVPPQAPSAPQAPAAPKAAWEEKPITPVPTDARNHILVREIVAALPDVVLEAVEFAGQVTATVPVARLAEVCRACKERL
jgi:hypothetical protein